MHFYFQIVGFGDKISCKPNVFYVSKLLVLKAFRYLKNNISKSS